MCSPGAAMAGMQIGGQYLDYQSERQDVAAYNRAQKKNRNSAFINHNNQTIQNNIGREDARINANSQATDNALSTARAKATARVSAGEAGGAGQSLDALLQGYNYNRDVAQGRIKANLEGELNQANANQAGYNAQLRSNVNKTQYKAKPNLFSSLLLPAAGSLMQYQIQSGGG